MKDMVQRKREEGDPAFLQLLTTEGLRMCEGGTDREIESQGEKLVIESRESILGLVPLL